MTKLKLVCLGDSLTFGFKMTRNNTWPQILEENLKIKVINKGICGDTTGGMVSRFGRDVLDEKPTHLLLMGGANDLIFNVPMPIIYSNLATMIYQAYHHKIQPIVGIHTPMVPSMAREIFEFTDDFERVNRELILLREWIFNFSNLMKFETVDFFNKFYDPVKKIGKENLYIDGVHPTIEGNKIMAQLVIEALNI